MPLPFAYGGANSQRLFEPRSDDQCSDEHERDERKREGDIVVKKFCPCPPKIVSIGLLDREHDFAARVTRFADLVRALCVP